MTNIIKWHAQYAAAGGMLFSLNLQCRHYLVNRETLDVLVNKNLHVVQVNGTKWKSDSCRVFGAKASICDKAVSDKRQNPVCKKVLEEFAVFF